jgi:hypothetical protein
MYFIMYFLSKIMMRDPVTVGFAFFLVDTMACWLVALLVSRVYFH